jgi:uncharacterized protein YndB with AHSA1/START domain
MSSEVAEQIVVAAPPVEVFDAVTEVRRMARWSPECFAVWVWRREHGRPARFVGWNRRGLFVWFTTCRVRVCDPGAEFVFDVTTFGLPVSRWGYRFAAVPDGTQVTEYWLDRRGRGSGLIGRIFTGPSANLRPQVNRDGMRQTLARLKQELESGPAGRQLDG